MTKYIYIYANPTVYIMLYTYTYVRVEMELITLRGTYHGLVRSSFAKLLQILCRPSAGRIKSVLCSAELMRTRLMSFHERPTLEKS